LTMKLNILVNHKSPQREFLMKWQKSRCYCKTCIRLLKWKDSLEASYHKTTNPYARNEHCSWNDHESLLPTRFAQGLIGEAAHEKTQ
jgi:hypothetical protein